MPEKFNPYESPAQPGGAGKSSSGAARSAPRPEDPIVSTARRESLVVLAAWLVALTWTVGYCVMYGYNTRGFDVAQMRLVMGVPDWIFWGILTPWFSCYLFSTWFCLVFMKDADLGADTSDDGEENNDAN